MARTAGVVLVFFASAAIALGTPLCCLVESGCCGTKTTAEASKPKHDCCSHGKREAPRNPAPKPCEEKKDCSCKPDATTHPAGAGHMPLVAVFEVPAIALPERAAADVGAAQHRAPPLAPARASHPLLL